MNEMKSLLFDRTLFDYQPESVANKSILITGGTTGIGRATAILLASQCARVMVFGRHEQELNDALKDIRQSGEEAFGLTADTANPQDIQRVFAEVDRQMGKLDSLINNAALAYPSITEGNYEDWQYVVNTNLLGYMAMTPAAIERMKPQGQGHIVYIGSMSADTRKKDSSVYVATKSG